MEYFADKLHSVEKIRVPEDIYYEGSGETIVWNDKILVGYGQRSNSKIV